MKHTAKILAILMALLLGAAIFLPLASAEEPRAPSLPPATGTLTIYKYIMANLNNANPPNDGRPITGGPDDDLDTSTSIPAGAVPIAGIIFDLYQLTHIIYVNDSGEEEFLPILDSNGNIITTPFGSEIIPGDFDRLTFTLDDYEAPTRIDLLTGYTVVDDNRPPRTIIGFGLGTQIEMPATNASGRSHSGPLARGFYLVVERFDDRVASIVFPFIVAVPMTNADGDGWIEDVFAYPKNGDISISKYIDRNAVHLGETVTIDVVVSIPADIRTYTQFDMSDILDRALTYVPGSLRVFGYKGIDPDPDPMDSLLYEAVNGGEYEPPLALQPWERFACASLAGTLTGAGRYFTVTEPIPGATPAGNNNTLTVVAERQTNTTTEFWKLSEYNFIRYQFDVIINENILENVSYTVENQATLTFRNRFDTMRDPDGPGRTRNSNWVRAHSAALIFDKVNANNNEVLEGAEFQIATTEANARAGRFLKIIPLNTAGEPAANGIDTIIDFGHEFYNHELAEDYVLTSTILEAPLPPGIPESFLGRAIVHFVGLKEFGNAHTNTHGRLFPPNMNGDNARAAIRRELEDQSRNSRLGDTRPNGAMPSHNSNAYLSYWIVETKAPEGFNLLFEPIRVDFGQANGSAALVGTGDPNTRNKTNFVNWYTVGSGSEGNSLITVRNSNRFILPQTGGMGTALFTAGGIALISVAGFLFVMSMRRKKQNAAK